MATRSKRYALAIDTEKCINCRACMVACRAENGVPLGYNRNWVEAEIRGEYPKLVAAFEPGQCQQCEDPACVRVCPTGASHRRADGIIAINEADCVGCRYCILACPYEARFFREDRGVVEKCNFCAQRVDRGESPACVETCPSHVRIFGDLNDPDSALRAVLDRRQQHTKKPEAGTNPQIFYLS